MTPADVRQGLSVLRNYYAKDGRPYTLNDAQWAVYVDGLRPFDAGELEAACRAWMQQSRWFPALSDLLGLMRGPAMSSEAQAHLAWSTVERAIARAGAYDGVTFANSAIGETVRQVFGSWAHACRYDTDSPGWAIRRQTFLALYPSLAQRTFTGPVTLRGMAANGRPVLIGAVDGLPALTGASEPAGSLTAGEASAFIGEIRARAALAAGKATA